ncbi:Similar to RTase: Probable RNA-directed DNA polymerase from transposon BS (Drosophila melanogaster), partial [Cotesia congregata]
HYPVQRDGDPKFLYNYIEVLAILKKLKNKTSSGLDNIPTIKVIPNNQFGFKRKHAFTHAIDKLLSDINNSLHNNLIVGAVFLDQEKSFDSVWINGLIYIMVTKNFPIGLIFLIIDMIIGNFYYTWDGKLLSSDCFIIQEGLQQERVLSPIFFNIYDCDTNLAAEL